MRATRRLQIDSNFDRVASAARAGSAGIGGSEAGTDYSEQTLVCIQNCQDCHRACLQTVTYCLKRGGRHADPDLLRRLMDCADICLTSAAFMIRASDLHAHTCAACAVVCQGCAEACAALSDDLRMKAVADTCRHCADSCGAMAAGHSGSAPWAPSTRGRDGAERAGGTNVRETRPAGSDAASRGPGRAAPVLSRRKTNLT